MKKSSSLSFAFPLTAVVGLSVVGLLSCGGGSSTGTGTGGTGQTTGTGGSTSTGQGGVGNVGAGGATLTGNGGSTTGAGGSIVSGAGGTGTATGGNSATGGGAGGDTTGSGGGAGGNGAGGVGAISGSGGTAGSGLSGSGGAGTGAGGSAAGGSSGSGAVAFASDRVIVTGVRNTATPAASTIIQLHNAGAASAQVTALTLSGANQTLFKISSPTTLPATIAAGANLAVTVQLATTGAGLPAAPANYDDGSNLLTASLTATTSAGSAQALVYGLLLIQANYEPTLGQILTTLGYKLNVGKAQNNWNPNTSMMAVDLPGVEAGTDEVAAQHFVKVGTGSVTMTLVARFSPYGLLPYGWYAPGSPNMRTVVGTMSMVTNAQTNNNARMVFPPLAANSATTFDPGASPFALWVYTDQATQTYEKNGKAVNGDYDYSEDALNSPANVHRYKTYPLKDAAGTAIPQEYLVAVEEAGNGDYQDYVFVLGNVKPSP